MNPNQMGELSSEQLKVRQLAEQYLKLQENTEYLTNVVRYQPTKKRVQLKLQQATPDIKSIASLTIQLSYFLFTCYVKKTNIYISLKLYYLNPNKRQNNPEVCCEYILEKDLFKFPEDHQRYLISQFTLHQFANSQTRSYAQYALFHVNRLLSLIRSQNEKFKLPQDRSMLKQFFVMEEIIKNFIEPKIQTLQHPRIFILALQQSELFRENSILVKIMNNSIFSAIRNSKHKNVYEQICKMEYNLTQIKTNKNQAQVHAREMEMSIQNFFRFLIKCQIITLEQSIQDQSKNDINLKQNINSGSSTTSSSTNTKPYALGEIEGTGPNDRRYTCKVQVNQKQIRQFNAKLYESIVSEALNNYSNEGQQYVEQKMGNDQKNINKNEFLIEYMPGKGIMSVKYITAIQLNIQNTDLIMFQCNSIAFHWSNVSMQLVEKSPNKPVKRKERYLAFKTISHVHISERPLFKLLIMIDLVMLCAKIAEPELRRNFVKSDDYKRIEQITQKVDHMIKLFIKKIERYYKMISQAQLGKNSP